mgnify:CR=1 FL=1
MILRQTKIVCTIGPASESLEMMENLAHAGMNIARLNFSHGDHQEHLSRIERIREVSDKTGHNIAIMLDTKGPEIRLRDFKEGKVELKAGQTFTLTTEEIEQIVSYMVIACTNNLI